MKHPAPQKKIKHRTLGVFVLVFALLLAVLTLLNRGLVKQEKLKAAYTAESTVANIEAQLNRYLAESELLKNIVESGYAINDSDFAALSELMSDEDGVIKAVELAPNGIVQYVYPLAENKGVIGLNVLQHPERKVEANLAKDSGQYTIAGPYELVQGGTGALLFDPIYTTDENGNQKYWGFALLVLDWKSFLDEVQITKLADASYEYRIWKDGHDGEPVTIAEGSHPVSADTLSVACSVPNDTWHFEIRPYSGWTSPTLLAFDVLLLLGLSALAAAWYWQAAQRRSRDTLHEAQLEKAAQEAQAASEAKSRFLFNMSHDIRTPMNAIIGYAELLEKHIDEKDRVHNYVDKIRSSSSFLLALINYVLEMACIESGKAALKTEPSDVRELLDSLDAVFEPLTEEKKLTYTCTADIRHPYVVSDRTKVREVFLNIISNAVKYTPEGGHVRFTLTELPGDTPDTLRYKAIIADDGIGMSEEYLPHLFEEFSREHTSTESKVVGTGLGLPIVKSLVELMHGTIDVESAFGKGTTFTVVLPFLIATEEQVKGKPGAQPAQNADHLAGKRILLAEDTDLNAEIAMTVLQENGMLVERAADGAACVELVKTHPAGYYSAVLMDIQMPVMNGYDAAKALRALPDGRGALPILAMTANAFEEDKQRAFESGMDAHIAKPISVNLLLDTLHRFLIG